MRIYVYFLCKTNLPHVAELTTTMYWLSATAQINSYISLPLADLSLFKSGLPRLDL